MIKLIIIIIFFVLSSTALDLQQVLLKYAYLLDNFWQHNKTFSRYYCEITMPQKFFNFLLTFVCNIGFLVNGLNPGVIS